MNIILVPDSVSMLLFHYRSALAVQWCECVVLHRKTLLYSHQTTLGRAEGVNISYSVQKGQTRLCGTQLIQLTLSSSQDQNM